MLCSLILSFQYPKLKDFYKLQRKKNRLLKEDDAISYRNCTPPINSCKKDVAICDDKLMCFHMMFWTNILTNSSTHTYVLEITSNKMFTQIFFGPFKLSKACQRWNVIPLFDHHSMFWMELIYRTDISYEHH